jgi:hypothetical protein
MNNPSADAGMELRNVAVFLKQQGMELSARVCESAADEIERLRLIVNPPPEPEPSLNAQMMLEIRGLMKEARRAEAVLKIRHASGCRLRTCLDYLNKHYPVAG